MVLDLFVKKEIDGFTAEIPSLDGVESWAHTEEEAIEKILDMLIFYFNIKDKKQIVIDRAAKKGKEFHYRVIFGGTHERVFD